MVRLKQKNGRIRKMIRHKSIVLPKIGTNEIGSDYLLFWRGKRIQFGYFKLAETAVRKGDDL